MRLYFLCILNITQGVRCSLSSSSVFSDSALVSSHLYLYADATIVYLHDWVMPYLQDERCTEMPDVDRRTQPLTQSDSRRILVIGHGAAIMLFIHLLQAN